MHSWYYERKLTYLWNTMLNYHLNITICKDLACQTLWHNVRHENDNEINWHFYSFKTFKLSFPCIVPKIDNIFWWLIINSNGYTKFENFQKCHTNGAEYRGQTHIHDGRHRGATDGEYWVPLYANIRGGCPYIRIMGVLIFGLWACPYIRTKFDFWKAGKLPIFRI